MRKTFLRLPMAAIVAFGLAATSARAETLADALAYGYDHSGLLEQNRALLRAADEGVAQAQAAFRPIVRYTGSISTPFSQSFGGDLLVSETFSLITQITLYDGGARDAALNTQRENVLATRASLLNVEQQVLLRIVEAYMNLMRSQQFVALRQSNVRLITRELRAARDRFEVGEITRTDVSLAEARLAAARSLLAAEQGTLARAQGEYAAAIGHAPGQMHWVNPVSITRSLAEAKAWAVRNHPAVRQGQHAVAAAELAIASAQSQLRPDLSLQGTFTVADSTQLGAEFGSTQGLSLNLSGPIYQGGALSSAIRQVMSRRDSVRAQLHVTVISVEQNVAASWSFLEVARASRDAFERQVQASTVAFNGVKEEADLGARTTLDVLNAEQELLDARANLISAEVDEAIASYTVLATMGLLTAGDLGLNVQLYDPSAYYNLVEGGPTRTSEQGQALERVLEALGRQ